MGLKPLVTNTVQAVLPSWVWVSKPNTLVECTCVRICAQLGIEHLD